MLPDGVQPYRVAQKAKNTSAKSKARVTQANKSATKGQSKSNKKK